MQRKTFLALTGGAMLTTAVGWKVLAQGRGTAPVKRRTTYVPTKPAPSSLQLQSPVIRSMGNSSYALVEEGPGLKIYSSRANEICAVALAGTVEWVGTATDIKRVDRKRNKVRVYSSADGLPVGEVRSLVGDETEAFALIVREDGKMQLCCFQASKDRWESFPLVPFQGAQYYPNGQGADLLVLGPTAVAYIPWYADLKQGSAPPFLLFDRRTRKLTPGVWDPAIKADHPSLETHFAAILGETLWLGTQIGVLGATLRTDETPPLWRRWLPGRSVIRGAVGSGGRLYLATVERNSHNNPKFELLDPKKGSSQILSDLPEQFDRYRLLASSLLATPEGTLWQVRASNGSFGPSRSLNPEVYRLRSGGTRWEEVLWSDVVPASPNPMAPPPKLADEKTLPDAVAAEVVCRLRENPRNFRMRTPFSGPGQGPWLMQRFWRWRGPDASAELPLELLVGGGWALRPTLTDSKDPDLVWLMQDGAFVSVPRKDVPKPDPSPTLPGTYAPVRVQTPGKVTAASARRYPIEMAGVVRGVRVSKLVGGAAPLALGAGAQKLLRLTSDQGARSVTLPDAKLYLMEGLVAGPSKTAFLRAQLDQKESWLCWDESKQELVEAGIAPLPAQRQITGTRQGLWQLPSGMSSADKTMAVSFLEIGVDGMPQGAWQKIEIPLPESPQSNFSSLPNYIASSAEGLWFVQSLPENKTCLRVWSPQEQQWSSSEPLDARSIGSLFGVALTEGPDGVVWVYLGEKTGRLVGYDPKARRWELSPQQPGVGGRERRGFVVAVTSALVWVLCADGLWRYDRTAHTWKKSEKALTALSLDTPMFMLPKNVAWSGGSTWWMGTFQGLWHFSTETEEFQAITESITAANTWFQPGLATEEAVWGAGDTLLARLDRKTGKARLFGSESLPGQTGIGNLRAGAGRTWLIGQHLHYFDDTAQRFVPVPLPTEAGTGRPLYCSAVTTMLGRPGAALLILQSGSGGALYQWEGGKLDPTPLAQPSGVRYPYDLHRLGELTYLVASDGLWRSDDSGRWEKLSSSVFSRLIRDETNPKVLWAISMLGGNGIGVEMSKIARIEQD